MQHENGEGEMERCDMRTANTLSHCVYAMSVRHARKMCQKNVRATRSVCTSFGCLLVELRTRLKAECHTKWRLGFWCHSGPQLHFMF